MSLWNLGGCRRQEGDRLIKCNSCVIEHGKLIKTREEEANSSCHWCYAPLWSRAFAVLCLSTKKINFRNWFPPEWYKVNTSFSCTQVSSDAAARTHRDFMGSPPEAEVHYYQQKFNTQGTRVLNYTQWPPKNRRDSKPCEHSADSSKPFPARLGAWARMSRDKAGP